MQIMKKTRYLQGRIIEENLLIQISLLQDRVSDAREIKTVINRIIYSTQNSECSIMDTGRRKTCADSGKHSFIVSRLELNSI